MAVGRRVATKRNAADLAGADVDPSRVDFHALFAFMFARRGDVGDRLDMRAGLLFHDYLQRTIGE